MIGCIALTAFLGLAAFKLLRHRRCAAGWGGGGCGPRGWHGPGGWGGPPWARHHRRGWGEERGPGGRDLMWMALSRLDLTPAQEKVVRGEVDKLKDKARTLRDEGGQSRGDIARALRDDGFDENAVAAMFIRHDEILHDLRGEVAGALGRIHAALDPAQRERLAEMIERGPRAVWGGPYR